MTVDTLWFTRGVIGDRKKNRLSFIFYFLLLDPLKMLLRDNDEAKYPVVL